MGTQCLGFDTSNYTTSAAVFGGGTAENRGRLLRRPGRRRHVALLVGAGIEGHSHRRRQGAALPGGTSDISAGQLVDRAGLLLGLPFPAGKALDGLYPEADGAGFFRVRWARMATPRALSVAYWGWANTAPQARSMVSGGTTELLRVEPEGHTVRAEVIGGTSDISAGQLVDRAPPRRSRAPEAPAISPGPPGWPEAARP